MELVFISFDEVKNTGKYPISLLIQEIQITTARETIERALQQPITLVWTEAIDSFLFPSINSSPASAFGKEAMRPFLISSHRYSLACWHQSCGLHFTTNKNINMKESIFFAKF